MVALRRAVIVALMSNNVGEVTAAACMCGPSHPYCYGGDHDCYTDPNSHDFDRNTCRGHCTSDFTANPKEYHYDQTVRAKQLHKEQAIHQQAPPPPPPITQEVVDRAVQEEKDAMKDAWQAVTDTQAYSSWLYNGATTEAYQEGVAEQIKTAAFARVDEYRHKVEMNLSSKVTAVSALSAKLATEPGGGTPSEQGQLTDLLQDVEVDRNRLKQFGLNKKIDMMHEVWGESKEKEFQRMSMLRYRNLESRKFFLSSTKYADHVQGKWGSWEDVCHSGCEEVFNSLEQTVEPVQDSAKDQISVVYDGIYHRVKHRIDLLRKAASGNGANSFFLYA